MKKFLSSLAAIFAAFGLALPVLAQTTFKVNGTGPDPTSASATTMSIASTSATSGTIVIANIAAIWKANPGANYTGAQGLTSEDEPGKTDWVLTYAANPQAFAGAKQCILKRGAHWPGDASLQSLRLNDPKVVCAPITGPSGTYTLALDDGDYDVLGIVPVIEFKDGSRAWGSHPFGQSRGKNSRGQTITLLQVLRGPNNSVQGMSAASAQAKAFFAGNFQ